MRGTSSPASPSMTTTGMPRARTVFSDSRSRPLQPINTAASSGAVVSDGALARLLVSQEKKTGTERSDGLGEPVHHQGLDGVEEGRAQVLFEDDPDDARASGAQRCRARIGAGVAQRGRSVHHPSTRRVRDRGLAAEHHRCRRRRNSRFACDVRDSGPACAHDGSIVPAHGPALSNRFDTARIDSVP